ncbi:heterokaryon incompatibility protein-domain-containing protein [Hypoxylon rubiginosum]|uniref:Heterokaryon incompatibility protein-domain-containing protein n=1 Tax=Hypoxylon rubiginosum TaxID=110542 RepID=A0ACB9Z564_9PEZI|nr:heterokaryon incompatibility protein-domain-containing protein [Hypoxylon rubiginosum]
MCAHKYPAPALGKGRFRLLRISEFTKGTPECVLSEHDLDSSPPYLPVSYTWGPAESPDSTSQLPNASVNTHRSITLNGQQWEVTPNLFDLLQELSSPQEAYSTYYFWIDALCVNQGNINERTSQVNLMDRVYTQGYGVFVWLGRANKYALRVKAIISQLARIYKDKMKGWQNLLASENTHISDGLSQFILDEAITDNDWDALASFFHRRWFFRVWTVQELALSRRATLRWGPVEIDWQELCDAAGIIVLTEYRQRVLLESQRQVPHRVSANVNLMLYEMAGQLLYASQDWFREYSTISNAWLYTKKQPCAAGIVSGLIGRARNLDASDPRDRIFAFLGIWGKIAKERFGQELSIRADYSKTVQAVYAEFMTTLLHETGSLNSLSLTGLHDETTEIEALPSWVPDYSIRSTGPIIRHVSLREPLKSIDAYANMRSHDPPQSEVGNRIFHIVGNELFIPTFVFGEITHVGNSALETFSKGDFSKTQELLLTSPQRHPDGRSRLRAFHSMLICDTSQLPVSQYRAWWTYQFLVRVDNIRRRSGLGPKEWFHLEMSQFLERMLAGEDDAYLPAFDDFKALCEKNGFWESANVNVQGIFEIPGLRNIVTELETFAQHVTLTYGPGRRPFLLDNGYFGMTSEYVRPGDTVRILPGARLFFTFRKVDQVDSKEDRQVLIGESYVSGAMAGEASEYVKQLGRQWENICVV